MVDFHNTLMGKHFYDATMPSIAKQLKRIADHMEKGSNAKDVISERTKDAIAVVLTPYEENYSDEELATAKEYLLDLIDGITPEE